MAASPQLLQFFQKQVTASALKCTLFPYCLMWALSQCRIRKMLSPQQFSNSHSNQVEQDTAGPHAAQHNDDPLTLHICTSQVQVQVQGQAFTLVLKDMVPPCHSVLKVLFAWKIPPGFSLLRHLCPEQSPQAEGAA